LGAVHGSVGVLLKVCRILALFWGYCQAGGRRDLQDVTAHTLLCGPRKRFQPRELHCINKGAAHHQLGLKRSAICLGSWLVTLGASVSRVGQTSPTSRVVATDAASDRGGEIKRRVSDVGDHSAGERDTEHFRPQVPDKQQENLMAMLGGKVAFITGGASGIGAGAALRFAREGARVVLADVQTEEGERVRDDIVGSGGQAIYVTCDVSEPHSVQQAIEAALKAFGRLDIVMANAGINGVWTPIEKLQPGDWDRTLDINLKGTYLTVHFAVPHLKAAGGGSIIITSSVNGNRTFSSPGASAYSTSKAGQVAFMKMMALELGRDNIRCNAVCPGLIHTHIQERTEQRGTDEIGIEVELPQGSPALHGGEGEAVDVADACLFLASDLARHVSGIEMYVDGGASLLR
jgi:NAD(P)-dependent dehydrogenase (short-subunit alcohol dehydrogenase family)